MNTINTMNALQHLAILTAHTRALDALLNPADPDKLNAAARAQGSLPWFVTPAPILDALRVAIAEYAPAAGAVSASTWKRCGPQASTTPPQALRIYGDRHPKPGELG